MIIGVDIGNTHIVTGVFNEIGEIILDFRISSSENLTEDEYFSYLKNISDFHDIRLEKIDDIVISSVVPTLTNIFIYLSKKYFKKDPVIVSTQLNLPITFKVDNPKEIGADRLCNIVAGYNRYPNKTLIIIDFGTATTFDVLYNKMYFGGSIIPGIDISIKALFSRTSKLPKVRFEETKSAIGKNTIEHINSGMFYGSIGQIKEIISQIEKEIGKSFIITTGGISDKISNYINMVDENIEQLTLKGLYQIYKLNRKK